MEGPTPAMENPRIVIYIYILEITKCPIQSNLRVNSIIAMQKTPNIILRGKTNEHSSPNRGPSPTMAFSKHRPSIASSVHHRRPSNFRDKKLSHGDESGTSRPEPGFWLQVLERKCRTWPCTATVDDISTLHMKKCCLIQLGGLVINCHTL